MLVTPHRNIPNRIVVLNSKGGCGKTTLATNLACSYVNRGLMPVIMDCDSQGSTMSWLRRRDKSLPPIHGIAAYKKTLVATRSWQLRVPVETTHLIIDSPCSLSHDDLREVTHDASSILVPVLPSAIDVHAASRCIADLLLVAKVDRRANKLAVVANRTRRNTRSFDMLMRFLDSLGIPVVGVLRDSQNFVFGAEQGIGIVEMQPYKVRKDIVELEKILMWLDASPKERQYAHNNSVAGTSSNVIKLHKQVGQSAPPVYESAGVKSIDNSIIMN